MTIIGISATAILGGLASALGSSGTHRSLTNLDAILRSYAEVARYDLQLRPLIQGGPLFTPCVPVSHYVVVSAPYPSSGAAGTAVTVFGSGFPGTPIVTVTDSTGVQDTLPANIRLSPNENFTATFIVPPGLSSGPATIHFTAGSISADAASSFNIDPSAPAVNPSPLADYQVGLSGIQYWNGIAFQPTCDTTTPDDQLQELTVSGTAPGASDQLNIIVADTNYVYPAPEVADTFIAQNGAPPAGAGYLADNQAYTVYADVIEPDGQPGIKSVTADVSNITTGQTAVPLSQVASNSINGHPYNYASSTLTAGSPSDGPVNFTINATDNDGLPSEYTGNGTVTFDTTPPTGSVTVNNSPNASGFITTSPLQVSFSAADSGSGLDASTAQLVELSTPLLNGVCQGTPANPTVVATGQTSSSGLPDPMATSGNCYEYRYTVSDNVGNWKTFTSSVVKFDPTPPSITLSFSNETNARNSGSTVIFGALAPQGASFNVTANITDPAWPNLTANFSNPPKGWTVTGTGNTLSYSSNGNSGKAGGSIRVTVTNGAGQAAPPQTIMLTPETSVPTVSIAVTSKGGYITPPVKVTFSAIGDAYGLDTGSAQLFQLSAPLSGGTCQGSFGNSVQVGPTGITSPYDDTSVTAGNCYEYQYVVTDNLGNPSTITSGPVMFAPPSIAILYPVDGSTYTTTPGQSTTWAGTITGTASDPASTVSGVVVAIEDTTTQEWWDGTSFDQPGQTNLPASGTTSWTYSLPGTALVDGDQYQVVATATDTAGVSNTSHASFTG